MSQLIDRRSFLGGSLLALCIPSRLFAEQKAESVVLRFAALSDVHYDQSHNDSSAEHVRFARALQFMKEYCESQPYSRWDALVVAGDVSNHGVPEEINAFKKTMDDNLPESVARVICMGNHEYYGGNRALWEETFKTNANRRQIVNGYHFITISPEKGTCNENDYLYVREWLEQNIKEAIAEDPNKSVFVVQHYHVRDTVYGSASLPDDFHAGVYDIADILKKYPQVFHISGHSHIPSYDPRAVWQGDFTAIGTGTLSYFALRLYERARNFQPGTNVDVNQAGTFLIFEVFQDNTIRVRLYDVISQTFLDREYLFVDPTNLSNYVYTDKRFDQASAPVWRSNASASVTETSPYAAAIRFTQARDEFCVVSYRIEAEIENNGQWESCGVYNAWSDYFMKEPLEALEFEIFKLRPNSKYRLKIFGVNAFQKETTRSLTLEFATPNDISVDRDAERPQPNFLDATFDVKKNEMVSSPTPPKVSYAPNFDPGTVVDDASLGSAVSLNGKNQAYIIPYSPIRAGMLQNEVSIGAKFRLDLSRKTDQEHVAIFGSTESGGLGFEYAPKSKTIIGRCWVNDKYEDVVAPLEHEDDVVAFMTYDSKELKLYIDGDLVASKECPGVFRLTNNDKAKAFCLGGDVCPKYQVRWFFPGFIARAGVYSWSLSPEQIANLSK